MLLWRRLRSNATDIRGLGGPSSSGPWALAVGDMPGPALCPGHALALTLPSTGRLPSTLSAPDLSAGIVRGFAGTMQPSDSSDLAIRLRLLAFPNRPGTARAVAGGRRSPRFRHDPWRLELVSDPGGATVPRRTVPHMLPAAVCSASASTVRVFRSSIQSSSSRCVRFKTIVADDPAKLATGRALPPSRSTGWSFAWRTQTDS